MKTPKRSPRWTRILIVIGIGAAGAFEFTPWTGLEALSAGEPAPQTSAYYVYTFNQPGAIEESGSMNTSPNPFWWVNSGGYLNIAEGRGWTVQGALPTLDPWRTLYAVTNPTDTDNGYHPQNIFRLVTPSTWQDVQQEAYFVITADNVSASPERNAWNGLLLMSRYLDGNNLYYAGIRVDGAAVIKKKRNGTYSTLAYTANVYPGAYDRSSNPNLLPKWRWIGLRSEVVTLPGGAVRLRLYIDKGWRGTWELVAEAVDEGTTFGPTITSAGFAGIRTDFMDVMFENFRLRNY